MVTKYVNRLGQNLALHSDTHLSFSFKITTSDQVNACAFPGGFVYLNAGLLKTADSEDEVAAVIAHEIGHVAARHGTEQLSKRELVGGVSLALGILASRSTPIAIADRLMGNAAPLTLLKYPRNNEVEADNLSAQYLWASGYDPRALDSFLRKLATLTKQSPSLLAQLTATHPFNQDRIKHAQELVNRFPPQSIHRDQDHEFQTVKSHLSSRSDNFPRSAPLKTASPKPTPEEKPERSVLRRKPQSSSQPDKQ